LRQTEKSEKKNKNNKGRKKKRLKQSDQHDFCPNAAKIESSKKLEISFFPRKEV